MKLKPRLAEVAKCILPESKVADIGTDHAYLPVYLIKQGICKKVIGVENNQQNLDKAQKTVDLFNLASKIELRLGNGLAALNTDDAIDVIVIAGLGGRTTVKIMLAGAGSLNRYKYFVLQPMSDIYLLRRWLLAHGFRISHERLAREKGHFYEIMIVQPGKQSISDPVMLEVGPGLVEAQDPLLVPYLEDKITSCRRIIDALSRAREGTSLKKRDYYLHKEARLKEVLSLVTASSGSNEYDE